MLLVVESRCDQDPGPMRALIRAALCFGLLLLLAARGARARPTTFRSRRRGATMRSKWSAARRWTRRSDLDLADADGLRPPGGVHSRACASSRVRRAARRGGGRRAVGRGAFPVLSTFPIEVTLASTERPPHALEVSLLKGNLKRLDGAYRIEPQDGGRMLLTWTGVVEARVDAAAARRNGDALQHRGPVPRHGARDRTARRAARASAASGRRSDEAARACRRCAASSSRRWPAGCATLEAPFRASSRVRCAAGARVRRVVPRAGRARRGGRTCATRRTRACRVSRTCASSRLLAALRPAAAVERAALQALADRMLALDLEARRYEIMNLPAGQIAAARRDDGVGCARAAAHARSAAGCCARSIWRSRESREALLAARRGSGRLPAR